MAQKNLIKSDEILNYACGICRNVLDEPYRPNVCNHVFCKSCLINSSVSNSTCPCCRKSFNIRSIVFAHQIRNKINTLRYQCDTCEEVIKLSDHNDHSQVCYPTVSKKPLAQSAQGAQGRNGSSYNLSSLRSSLNSSSNTGTVNRHTFKCPYCFQPNLTYDDMREHCNTFHVDGEKNVVCPICASMPWGDANYKSIDFIGHLNLRHRFEYENYVDFQIDDDEMFERAITNSLNDLTFKQRGSNWKTQVVGH